MEPQIIESFFTMNVVAACMRDLSCLTKLFEDDKLFNDFIINYVLTDRTDLLLAPGDTVASVFLYTDNRMNLSIFQIRYLIGINEMSPSKFNGEVYVLLTEKYKSDFAFRFQRYLVQPENFDVFFRNAMLNGGDNFLKTIMYNMLVYEQEAAVRFFPNIAKTQTFIAEAVEVIKADRAHYAETFLE